MFVKVAFLLKAMICREVSIVFKVIVQTGLFLLFLFFFGIPAVEKYLRAETVIITWEEDTGGIEPPAVTFSGSLIGKVGWKGAFENASVNYVNFKIVDQCDRYDDDIQQCVLDETFGLNELILGARFGQHAHEQQFLDGGLDSHLHRQILHLHNQEQKAHPCYQGLPSLCLEQVNSHRDPRP